MITVEGDPVTAVDVACIGPCRLHYALSRSHLIREGYDVLQMAASNVLNDRRWQFPTSNREARRSGFALDVDNRRGDTNVPTWFCTYSVVGTELEALFASANIEHTRQLSGFSQGNARLRLKRLELRFFEFGYASIELSGSLEDLQGDIKRKQLINIIENLSSDFADCQALLRTASNQLKRALPRTLIKEKRSQDKKKHKDSIEWLHRVISIRMKGAELTATCEEDYREVIPTTLNDGIRDAWPYPDAMILATSGTSIAVQTETSDKDISRFENVVAVQNVFWAAAEDLDSQLFWFVNELSVLSQNKDIAELERRAQKIVNFQETTAYFQSLYEDFRDHLDPLSLLAWQALSKAWRTSDKFSSLNSKVSRLEKIFDRNMQILGNLQSSRLNKYVLFFTLLSFITVITGIVEYTQGGDLSVPNIIRLSLLAFAAIFVFGFWMYLIGRRRS